MSVIVRRAPAKINLTLRVLGRGEDGYHRLESLFLPLGLGDEVRLRLEPGGEGICCRCPGHPELDGAHNLAARAARTYLRSAGRRARVEITIAKQIWAAAGLGGGSSDGAAVLATLQDQLQALPPGQLEELARSLGADLPFFLLGIPALARGIGQRLTPLAGVPALPLVLCNPGLPLSTARVFAALGLARGQRVAPAAALAPLPPTAAGLAALASNDLWPAALGLCPPLGDLRRRLRQRRGCLAAGLSGSGPTLFGVFEDPAAARRAARELDGQGGTRALFTWSTASPA